MSNEIVKSLLELLKLAPRYFIAFGIAAALMLFSNDDTLQRFGVFDLAKNYRPWLGIIFILSLTMILITLINQTAKWIRKFHRERIFFKEIIERLNSLTEDEKQILRFYIAKQTKTNFLRIDDGVVQGLVSAGIIYRAANFGDIRRFPYNISEIAWDYLNINQSLLVGTTNSWRTDKTDF